MKSYAAFEALIAPARSRTGVLRLVAGTLMVGMLYLVFFLSWTFFAVWLLPVNANPAVVLRGEGVLDMVVVMSGFGGLILALYLVLNLFHKRGLGSLIGSLPRALQQGKDVGKLCLLLFVVIYLIPMPGDDGLEQAMSLPKWLVLLPVSFVLLAIQCGAEELVFRGYLQSQCAAESKNPLVWMGLPSLLFGWLHYAPDLYGDVALWVALWAVVFGALMADITARAGTLGPAIVIHMINNFFAMCVTGFKTDLGGLALYHLPFGPADKEIMAALVPLELLSMVCMWLVARIALRR